ncbi:MAG: ATP-binding cassette domain-containing protein, partial [Acidimicrobiales bacterium]|nr:ATP-binding cassette domain-containing protein [Acidimicrobiales bacterium]
LSFFNGFFVLLLAPEFYLPLRTLGSAYHARMEAIGAGERVVALLSVKPVGVASGTTNTNPVAIDGRNCHIQLEGVSVAFPDGRVGLRGVDLEIVPGETLALVGASGGGKSMVLNLLLGFVTPTQGRVVIDDAALEDIRLSHWREQITYLPQRPHVFDATIRSNIAMRFDDGPIDEDRLLDAAKRAHIDQVISALPEGYDTRLGERGYGLSGGEVQRLALARAFYRDTPIILIDEATAHLDSESEAIVATGLEDLVAHRTCVMIAHRSATLIFADRVAVIDDGTVREITSADDWVAANPTALVEPLSLSPSTGPEGGEP